MGAGRLADDFAKKARREISNRSVIALLFNGLAGFRWEQEKSESVVAGATALDNGRGIHFDGYGAAEKGDRNNEPLAAFHFNKDAFDAAQGSGSDADAVSDLQEGAGQAGNSGRNEGADGLDFAVVNRDRHMVVTDDLSDTRSFQNGQPVVRIKPAKKVARK